MTQDDSRRVSPGTPLDTFGKCHVGILAQLDTLAGLPLLMAAAAQAREAAARLLAFFDDVVVEHHADEERDLFPAVLASTIDGDERARVQSVVDRLTAEHREIEAAWGQLKPSLRQAAKGRDGQLDAATVAAVTDLYRAHAEFEEQVFLPLSHEILGRDGNHMAALGVALHLRHVLPDVLGRYGGRA